MKVFFLLAISICFFKITSAQKADLFPKIEKLLNASTGEKVSELTGDYKLSKQKFSKTSISESKEDLSTKTIWITEYKNLDWKGGYEIEISNDTGNDKVSALEISFKNQTDYWYYPADEKDKGDKETTIILKLYFLAKDNTLMRKLVDDFNAVQ